MKLLSVLNAAMSRPIVKAAGMLAPVSARGGWFPWIREPYAGAWQKNDEWTVDTALAYHAVYACITRIANSIGKLPLSLMEVDTDGIWSPVSVAAFSPVLRNPNRFQNHLQFKQWWITSKLIRGNAYVLKERDARNVVVRLYLLDPSLVTVLVALDGSVFYQLKPDNLNGVGQEDVTVPASEIIHDRMNCLFHPLVGISPLFAGGLAATQGQKIQRDSSIFFANGANPGGVLTAPGAIDPETAVRLQEKWTANFTGENAGKVAVMGDGLRFEPMRMSYADAQLIEQLKWTADVVCSVFGVPPFKIGMGSVPGGMKVGDLNQMYYDDALHSLIEEMEACLDEGLALPANYRTELDLDNLLRMDPATQADTLVKLVGGAISAPNEARKRLNLGPIKGGDTVYLQQQNYSLSALDERDKTNPLVKEPAPAAVTPATPDPASLADSNEGAAAQQTRAFLDQIQKGLSHDV